VRQLEVDKGVGLHRAAWNLRADAPAAPAERRPSAAAAALVAPGRYAAVLGKRVGERVTPLGRAQAFSVVAVE
jgi:hypothetical protein